MKFVMGKEEFDKIIPRALSSAEIYLDKIYDSIEKTANGSYSLNVKAYKQLYILRNIISDLMRFIMIAARKFEDLQLSTENPDMRDICWKAAAFLHYVGDSPNVKNSNGDYVWPKKPYSDTIADLENDDRYWRNREAFKFFTNYDLL